MSGLRLIIENHPAWNQHAPETETSSALPAASHTLYTLLGRRGTQWHTVVPRIDDPEDAVHAMDSANRSQLFDRLVIASARAVVGQPAEKWETFACAVPFTLLQPLPRKSFADLLDRAERRQSDIPQAIRALTMTSDAHPTPIRPERRDAGLMLGLLVLLSLWSQSPSLLAGVGALGVFEALYQSGALDRQISSSQAEFVRTGRFYLYALCAGMMALPMVVRLFLGL